MLTSNLNMFHAQPLKVDGTVVSSYALTNGTAVYSDPIRAKYSNGYAALLVLCTGGSDDVDITFEVSLDGTNWYVPYTADGTSLTDAGGIVIALTASRWMDISSRIRIAPWVRFKLDPDANSTVTAYYLQQE